MKGLVHLLYGDGKGKTSAAAGAALRAAGAGKKVLFAQFLKPGTSSEIPLLKAAGGIEVRCFFPGKWVRDMTQEERAAAAVPCGEFLQAIIQDAARFDFVILDEILPACVGGLVQEEALLSFLDGKPEETEVILTGRQPSQALLQRADYATEMKKIKHPFDSGISARKGVEF